MSRRASLALRLLVLLGLVAACAPFSRGEGAVARNGLSAFVVWSSAPLEPGRAVDGRSVDVVRVRAGQIVRLELAGSGPQWVGERTTAGATLAESWSSHTPEGGIVMVRPGPLAAAVLVPRGSVRRAQIGRSSDPGYAWFELEDQVVAWADGPLLADFPAIAPATRVDRRGFSELDHELFDEVTRAHDAPAWLAAAHAVRRVAALRAVRALRPPTGYPYFWDERPPGGPGAQEVLPGHELRLSVTGPALLHLWALVPGQSDSVAEVRVFEGARLRATAAASLPRSPMTHDDAASPASRALRRAVVHVPSGTHSYRIESTTRTLVTPLVARPVVHLEDTQKKSEEAAIATARTMCEPGGSAALCAFALALSGDDASDPKAGGRSSYAQALAGSTLRARRVAEDLAAGGPRDPIIELETLGSAGDAEALEALERATRESSDEGARSAWSHAIARGTRWSVSGGESSEVHWTAFASDTDDSSCGGDASTWPELTAEERTLTTRSWNGAPSVELVVVAPCDEAAPVELEVDGQRLLGNPAGGQVRWHVRVRGATARARRLDAGHAHVYALTPSDVACSRHFESIRAPQVASLAPTLSFDSDSALPGVELWLRDGAERAVVDVAAALPHAPDEQVHLVAARTNGLVARDPSGARWTRVGRVALPDWAAEGARVTGGSGVAVRALVRTTRIASTPVAAPSEPPAPFAEPDEAGLAELSRAIANAASGERGRLYLTRALALATAGAGPAALSDARAARALGARGPRGEDPVVLARASLKRRPLTLELLPEGVSAYGVEVDFDPGARRCQPSPTGDRALFAAATGQAQPASEEPTGRAYDPATAARIVAAVQRAPLDPRAPRLLAQALAGSRWRIRRDLAGDLRRVPKSEPRGREGPIDPEGELRPRVLTGEPFAEGTYVTVTAEREARAVLDALAPGTSVTVEAVCGAREPESTAGAPCPLELTFGGELQPLAFSATGRGEVSLRWKGRRSTLGLHLRDDPARWVALVRVTLDHAVPGAIAIDESHWVLAPPQLEPRYLVAPGKELRIDANEPTLLRLGIQPGGAARFEVDGREGTLPVDGSPEVVPLPAGGHVTVKPTSGPISLLVAERVPAPTPARADEGTASQARLAAPRPIVLRGGAAARSAGSPWLENARRSPRPLTPFESSLGTLVAESDLDYGTIQSGAPARGTPVAVLFTALGYRRRIESINLYTAFDVFARERSGEPTHGGRATLYEDLERWHVRLSQTAAFVTQRLAGIDARTWEARGFAEYSARLTHDLFFLPRLGYDGVYTSLPSRPSSLVEADDEVYSPYRARRPTLLFAQALLWYAPYFNEISYLRLRATADPAIPALAHLAVRPGVLAVLGAVDISTFADLVWHLPSDSITGRPSLSEALGTVARLDQWFGFGSLGVEPGIAGAWHPKDGGYQLSAFLNLLGSYRRGLRDYSSLELDFPEQRSGLIPWRGSTPGGYQ